MPAGRTTIARIQIHSIAGNVGGAMVGVRRTVTSSKTPLRWRNLRAGGVCPVLLRPTVRGWRARANFACIGGACPVGFNRTRRSEREKALTAKISGFNSEGWYLRRERWMDALSGVTGLRSMGGLRAPCRIERAQGRGMIRLAASGHGGHANKTKPAAIAGAREDRATPWGILALFLRKRRICTGM